eukprot:3935880-Rhodomonas_salina.2
MSASGASTDRCTPPTSRPLFAQPCDILRIKQQKKIRRSKSRKEKEGKHRGRDHCRERTVDVAQRKLEIVSMRGGSSAANCALTNGWTACLKRSSRMPCSTSSQE